ncbi:MAG: HlyC/CorC family transporter [Actinobacteria bacterium]|jgi:CBS domain containing-hemolysin-like protein|nr:HlyC/CorC family transporter [Actinomycetota bacterium]NDA94995.1 HlyC/CorC family transporter [Actinomycetota bacterium]NDH80914.1 HlyC/CorC family transporter [Actinomycetota bacterium]NDH99636.1 HlyC/CorC family transporter [Actinomycetota bacterium]NDI07443.1 HlyC/CorC family transporter [Actinomycetota bacterium]
MGRNAMSPYAIAAIILLLGFAGFLAATESALTSISRVLIEELESKRGGELLRKFTLQPAKYLNVILLVRKTCELTATVLLASILLRNYPSAQAMALTVLIMVIVSYVVVGVGPRTLGRQHPHTWARAGIGVAFFLAFILGPVTKLLIAIGNAITPGVGFRTGPFTNEAELRDLVDQAHERGLVESDEHEMIHSVFELGDTLVRELMVPRTEMVWIEKDKTLRQALSLALRSGFSRVPVVGDSIDRIIGIAYVKDLARRTLDHHEAETTERVEQHMRPATFVPESKIAADLLKEMQRDQIHLAIVVDEYGGTAGIITIEDILEEIVGEIADEFDDGVEAFTWISDGKARAKATLHIEDLADELGIEISKEDFEDVDTIGGLMAQKLGRVPIAGSTITVGQYLITSERPVGRRRRISSVLIEKESAGDDNL